MNVVNALKQRIKVKEGMNWNLALLRKKDEK
jgi:hypothetical protein